MTLKNSLQRSLSRAIATGMLLAAFALSPAWSLALDDAAPRPPAPAPAAPAAPALPRARVFAGRNARMPVRVIQGGTVQFIDANGNVVTPDGQQMVGPGGWQNVPSASGGPLNAGTVEARFTDNSLIKLAVKDEKINLQTPYGKLVVPMSDIRRIEFARRTTPEIAKRISTAIAKLGDKDYHVREAATAELITLGGHAYQPLLNVGKSKDAEVEVRVEELLEKLIRTLPEEERKVPTNDIVYTDDSKLTGQIEATSLKVETTQFGQQELKLSDLRSLGGATRTDDAALLASALPDPGRMDAYARRVGQKFVFRVTGNGNGSVWGDEIYTTDSQLSKAAVHIGVLKPGQTGVVKVEILGPQNSYAGTTRNGVTTSAFGDYPSSYKILR